MNILVVGGGSIGERHLRNFLKIPNTKVSMCEPRTKRLTELSKRYSIDRRYASFDDIDFRYFNGMVICVPAHLHIQYALKAAEEGCHVLMEKPVSINLDGIDKLIKLRDKKYLTIGVAYCLRHNPCLKLIKEKIEKKEIGSVKAAVSVGGQFLPKYRPDYKGIYFARKETGGGVIMDMITHSLNFVQWCLGKPVEVVSMYDRLVLDGIETEDVANILVRFENNILAGFHTNMFQKDDYNFMEFIGTEGTLRWDYKEGRIGIYKNDNKGWQWSEAIQGERDDQFIAQAQNFINAVDGKEKITTSIEEAVTTLKISLAAKKSYNEKRIIKICNSIAIKNNEEWKR